MRLSCRFMMAEIGGRNIAMMASENAGVEGGQAGEDAVARHFENIRAFISAATLGKIDQKDAPVPENGTNKDIIRYVGTGQTASSLASTFKYTAFSSAKFLNETRTTKEHGKDVEKARGDFAAALDAFHLLNAGDGYLTKAHPK